MPDSTATVAAESVSTADETKRVNVIFTKQQYDLLEKLAKLQGISLSDALRQAINISDLIVTANADPNTRILLEKGDKAQELKIVR